MDKIKLVGDKTAFLSPSLLSGDLLHLLYASIKVQDI
jgi:hypothetical protein